MKKNGFMATSLLYAFFILFVALMMGIIANYAHNRILLKTTNEEVAKKLGEKLEEDIFFTGNSSNSSYKDASGAESPVLNNGLIPVVYQDNKWVKADTTKAWYDYDTQWWANAVTVTSSSRSAHASSEAGTEIPMNDIETMWVWVPRYEYNFKLLEATANYGGTSSNKGTATQPKGIEINFISKDTVSASSSNFTIHDAFKWGDNKESQLSGIWVAKFEMSTGNTTCTPANYSKKTGCDLITITPQVKPNVTSWRGARVGTFWTAIHRNMNGTDNRYGLTNTDAHLMKNMEWGAVAYLSQSEYGKYGNADYTGVNKEIYQNKSSNYITGMSNGTPSSSTTNTQTAYNVEGNGTGASTTGNIYGIYDMSGGAAEYVMGIMKAKGFNEPAVGDNNTTSNSGWDGKLHSGTDYKEETFGPLAGENGIGKRYYDLYEYGTNGNDYTRGHLGDATYETVGWYSDSAGFINNAVVFFNRGGLNSYGGGISGVFFFYYNLGSGSSTSATGRPVLVPLN